MKTLNLLGSVLVVLFGIFLFFYGGYDDSPGAQGLGLVIAAAGVVTLIRGRRKTM